MSGFSVVAFVLLGLVGLSQQAFITEIDYRSANCDGRMSQVKSMNFMVNECIPQHRLIAKYDANNANPITMTYFDDDACQVISPTRPAASHLANKCESYSGGSALFTYSDNAPVIDGVYSLSIYSGSSSNCDGNLVFFQQTFPFCYQVTNGEFRSQRDSCGGNTGTTMRCYDNACQNCTVDNLVITGACDATSRSAVTCGAPGVVGGSLIQNSGKPGSKVVPLGSDDQPQSGASGRFASLALALGFVVAGAML